MGVLFVCGNPAQRWLHRVERGESVEEIVVSEIDREAERDASYRLLVNQNPNGALTKAASFDQSGSSTCRHRAMLLCSP